MRVFFQTCNRFALLCLTGLAISAPAHAEDKTAETAQTSAPVAKHAIALHGEPKYKEGFAHLDYVNPDAPKGGSLKLSEMGTFDSLNPFIVKGSPAAGLNYLRSGLVFESLMQNAWDEPFSLYGILAKDITIPADKSWVKFTLREEAKWPDGKPITAEDVIWTFNALTEEGQPFFKAYWHDVTSVEAEGDKTVIFKFGVSGNAELPLIVAEMVVLPKHYWTAEGKTFNKTTLDAPMGSGPYMISKAVPGRTIEYERNPNWWGKDLPFFKGKYNFDRITYDYYRDDNVKHEAFLSQDYDLKIENIAKMWKESYVVSDSKKEHLIKAEIENSRPAGMQAFAFNIRRPLFQDIKVRQALGYAFDFEWSNKQFAYGDYVRTNSFFENSELASHGGLPSEDELKILEPVRDKIPPQVFTEIYKAPVTDASGRIRNNMRAAIKLLEEAGYKELNKDGIRYKTLENGEIQTLDFEILYYSATFERWVLPFVKNLKQIGVAANFRVVDTAQFQRRMNSYDFDMTISTYGQSSSPGNEQREFWGSNKADIEGSRNYIGIKDPVIDDIVTQIIHATSREDLVTKTRALDRILLWNHYVIPMWHYPKWRIAYWDHIKRPNTLSGMSPLITETWWSSKATDSAK